MLIKLLGYGVILAGVAWALVLLNRPDQGGNGQGPVALLIGLGFGLLTAHAVGEGSVRGAQQRIHRSERPQTFWLVIALRAAVVVGMLWAAVVLFRS